MSNSLVRQYLPGDFTPGSLTQHNMDENSRNWTNIQHIVLKAVGKENSIKFVVVNAGKISNKSINVS